MFEKVCCRADRLGFSSNGHDCSVGNVLSVLEEIPEKNAYERKKVESASVRTGVLSPKKLNSRRGCSTHKTGG